MSGEAPVYECAYCEQALSGPMAHDCDYSPKGIKRNLDALRVESQNAFKGLFAIQCELLEALEKVEAGITYVSSHDPLPALRRARALVDQVKAVAAAHDAKVKS